MNNSCKILLTVTDFCYYIFFVSSYFRKIVRLVSWSAEVAHTVSLSVKYINMECVRRGIGIVPKGTSLYFHILYSKWPNFLLDKKLHKHIYMQFIYVFIKSVSYILWFAMHQCAGSVFSSNSESLYKPFENHYKPYTRRIVMVVLVVDWGSVFFSIHAWSQWPP